MSSAAEMFFVGTAPTKARYAQLLDATDMQWFEFGQDRPMQLADAVAVVVDLPLATVPEARKVRAALSGLKPGVPMLFVVDKGQRTEVVHAGAIGASAIANRPLAKPDLTKFLDQARKRQSLQRSASAQSRPAQQSESAISIRNAAASLDGLFKAVTAGDAPDHVKVYAACDEVATAISHDGLAPWLDTVRSHHQGTMQHCIIVAGVLTRFAQAAGMSDADVRMMTRVGLLHDVGKAVIPTALLDKPGKLTDEEFAVIKTHPYQGFKFLAKHGDVPQDTLAAVVGHHEYLDGSGYPYALTARAIDAQVRITTVCDIYGALVERRAYKAEMQPAAAIAILEGMVEAGKLEGALVRHLARAVLG